MNSKRTEINYSKFIFIHSKSSFFFLFLFFLFIFYFSFCFDSFIYFVCRWFLLSSVSLCVHRTINSKTDIFFFYFVKKHLKKSSKKCASKLKKNRKKPNIFLFLCSILNNFSFHSFVYVYIVIVFLLLLRNLKRVCCGAFERVLLLFVVV